VSSHQIFLMACSGDVLGKLLERHTATILTDMVDDFHSGEQAGWLHDCPLSVNPVRFDRIQPGTFDRQAPGEEADASVSLGLLTVGGDPRADRSADVPGRMVPDEDQDPFLLGRQPLAEPGEGDR
jgi:hypothetical protein